MFVRGGGRFVREGRGRISCSSFAVSEYFVVYLLCC